MAGLGTALATGIKNYLDKQKQSKAAGWGYQTPSQTRAEAYTSGSKDPYSSEYRSAKSAQKDWEKQLELQGYRPEARPYEYDASAFQDPNYAGNKSMLQQALAQRQGVQASTMDTSLSDQFRNYQSQLATQLQAQATGQAPSLAQLQLQQGNEQAIAAQRAAAASSANPLLGMRTSMTNLGQMQSGLANQAAQLRLQEQLQAQNALAGLSQGARQQDIGISELNLKSQIAEQAMQDQMTQYYTSQGLSQDQAQWQARMDLENMRAQQHSQAQGTQTQYINQGGGGGAGSALGAAGALGAGILGIFSDIRLKENITPMSQRQNMLVNSMDSMVKGGVNPEMAADMARNQMYPAMSQANPNIYSRIGNSLPSMLSGLGGFFSDKNLKSNKKIKSSLREFMDKIKAYQYNYKGEPSSVKRIGVMAQDMEKSKLGKKAIFNVNNFKAIDGKTAISLSLASVADLNKRLKTLEVSKGA